MMAQMLGLGLLLLLAASTSAFVPTNGEAGFLP